MGLMSLLFGTSESNTPGKRFSHDGDHNIEKSQVLAPTHPLVPAPQSPGKFDSIRSVPILESPRYFDQGEMLALRSLAREQRQKARYSDQVYESLMDVDDSDVQVHAAHYNYRTHLARNEVAKLSANTKYAEYLHGLRPGYAQLDARIERADQKAQAKIQELKSQIRARLIQ
ncbi:MAG: hypothetical protein HC825_05485 [Oscillatoriales cyanobacterium RM1_1_9]|nr:hypothetical protein [Oscillatoriales cyanobacterium SM2_3_0]NJO45183.1 hypothetical protein [Oscillatoriales cyanobacterium RM2_1_1]NJO71285.1 hypothetical protein [Oscillatoriales cyanobacterium RM1_1_9]